MTGYFMLYTSRNIYIPNIGEISTRAMLYKILYCDIFTVS